MPVMRPGRVSLGANSTLAVSKRCGTPYQVRLRRRKGEEVRISSERVETGQCSTEWAQHTTNLSLLPAAARHARRSAERAEQERRRRSLMQQLLDGQPDGS